jgi:hypothetical protein
MPRETATFVRCDGPGCKELAKILDPIEAPPGWYQVIMATPKNSEMSHYHRGGGSWEFHSLKCLAKWGRLRDQTLKSKTNGKIHRSSFPTEAEQKTVVTENGRYDSAREQIITAFSLDENTVLSVTEVSGLVDLNKSTINRIVNELYEENVIEKAIEGKGPYPSKYRLVTE